MDNCGLQVIQLLECPAPPPGPPRSTYTSTSYATSAEDEDGVSEDAEDQPCTSYCSSVSDLPEPTLSDPSRRASSAAPSAAMSRITAWRKISVLCVDDAETSSTGSGKRKQLHDGEGIDDLTSPCPKRPREWPVPASNDSKASALATFACPACDSFFSTVHALQQHGEEARAHDYEACSAAVQYALE